MYMYFLLKLYGTRGCCFSQTIVFITILLVVILASPKTLLFKENQYAASSFINFLNNYLYIMNFRPKFGHIALKRICIDGQMNSTSFTHIVCSTASRIITVFKKVAWRISVI